MTLAENRENTLAPSQDEEATSWPPVPTASGVVAVGRDCGKEVVRGPEVHAAHFLWLYCFVQCPRAWVCLFVCLPLSELLTFAFQPARFSSFWSEVPERKVFFSGFD